MLHRNTSSRRRRASRSAASSPQIRTPRSAAISPGRRASIAVSPVEPARPLLPEINRSPRHSLVPDISLSRDSLDLESPTRTPRNGFISEGRSPRNSLVPVEYSRSPRNSLVPDVLSPRNNYVPDSALSPRNSLVPDAALSPRNSLVPDSFNRSPRNSLVPDFNKSPRNSLVPDCSRSPRHSLTPESYASRNTFTDNNEPNRSPRHSLTPENYSSRNNLSADFNRSPRNSLVPDGNRSSRHSLVPSESTVWRTSPNSEEPGQRSPRHTSPRGSIAPENCRTSPRDSIVSEYLEDRSPRGSICPEPGFNRSPRGSLGPDCRSGRNTAESGRSPRGSLTLTFQEPPASERRYSADNQTGGKPLARSTSPYRMSLRGPQVNLGYSGSNWSETGSRRASTSVSQVALPQVSGEEQRRLCTEHSKLSSGAGGALGGGGGGGGGSLSGIESGLPIGVSLATYGSVTYQLKDANLEASNTCDFVFRALRIVNKTVIVTVILVCLSTLPLIMLIMGIKFLRDCPREPHIPVYMVVGGSVGCIKMAWVLWRQLTTRHLDDGVLAASSSAGSRVASLALTIFLVAWFALGNYWIMKIKWPDYTPTLYEPSRWCHRTLYVFSVVHLYIMYSVFLMIGCMIITLAGCQLVGCPWLGPGRYK